MRPDGKGLSCFVCGEHKLDVRDSRPSRNAVRRRRRCARCGAKFTTFEIMSPTQDDTHRLYDALHYYDALRALPEAHRDAVLAMVRALGPDAEKRSAGPPLIIGARGLLALDAALGPLDDEAPRG
jgi:hypothetical protein